MEDNSSFLAGRRYERLLLFGVLALAFSALSLFLSIALRFENGRFLARCMDVGATAIEQIISGKQGDEARKQIYRAYTELPEHAGEASLDRTRYMTHLVKYTDFDNDVCFKVMSRHAWKLSELDPDQALASLRENSKKLKSEPVEFMGIALPADARFTIHGNRVELSASVLDLVLKLALGPTILLWLASILSTRAKEFDSSPRKGHPPFPHAMNFGPDNDHFYQRFDFGGFFFASVKVIIVITVFVLPTIVLLAANILSVGSILKPISVALALICVTLGFVVALAELRQNIKKVSGTISDSKNEN